MSSPAAVETRISVGIGQLAVSRDPGVILVAYGLGSCIGVSAYDPGSGVVGMVHVLLPDSEGRVPEKGEPARYADTAIPSLVQAMSGLGANVSRLVLKLAGGASVLGQANAQKFKIGERNAEAIKEQLKRNALRCCAETLGGTKGRTLELHAATGKTYVRTAASPAVEL